MEPGRAGVDAANAITRSGGVDGRLARGVRIVDPDAAPHCFHPTPEPSRVHDRITRTVSKKNSHYTEGDALPFCLVGMTVGSTGNVIGIQWDTTEADVHAYAYLESFTATETLSWGTTLRRRVRLQSGTFTTFFVPADPALAE